MRPHRNSCWEVDKLEMSCHTSKLLSCFGILNPNFKQGVIDTRSVGVVHIYGSVFLVRGIVWRGNVVRQKISIGN